jgi:hypothetical protein
MQLVADSKTCRPGESVGLTVRIRNVGTVARTVCKHPALYSRYLTGPGGAEARVSREMASKEPRLPGRADLVLLQPGKTLKVRLGTFDTVIEDGYFATGWKATARPSQPGLYRLRAHYCGVPAYGSSDLRPCWAGVLTSNTVTLVCRSDE